MALNDIKRSRFNELLVRLFGMEAFPPAGQLATEIVPTILVEPYGPENYWLASHKLCAATFGATGGAASRVVVRLRNPVNSGIVAIVELLMVSSSVVDIVNVRTGAATLDFATVLAAPDKGFRDRRILGSPTCAASQGLDPAGIVITQLANFRMLANTAVQLRDLVVLTPGQALDADFATDFATDLATMWWRERALAEVENVS